MKRVAYTQPYTAGLFQANGAVQRAQPTQICTTEIAARGSWLQVRSSSPVGRLSLASIATSQHSRWYTTAQAKPFDALSFLKGLRERKAEEPTGTPSRPAFLQRERNVQEGVIPGTERFGELGARLKALSWDTNNLPPFEKNLYKLHPELNGLSSADILRIRNELDVKVVLGADKCPPPGRTFEECGLPDFLIDHLASHGLTTPTSIQAQGIPAVLSGHDLIGRAETGSGKTLAFLLPACVHVKAQPMHKSGDGPIALVLAPTRELAVQISDEVRKYGVTSSRSRVNTAVLYGGVSKRVQMQSVQMAELVIATPGRLIDILETGVTNLKRVTYLVLDEADRMLDMGFEPQIRKIVSQIRPDRQTLMWSATWPKEVNTLAHEFLRSPVQLNVGHIGLAANPNVTQIVDVVADDNEKQTKLLEMVGTLMSNPDAKLLVFCGTKTKCDLLANLLQDKGIPAVVIHGDKTQRERDNAIFGFKKGRSPILVATDVAARGLDVKDVQYVINYDYPGDNEVYVHRIGRTGRAGATGIAYSFITSNQARLADGLIRIMEQAKQDVSAELKALANQREASNSSFRSGRSGYGGSASRRPAGRNFGFNRDSSSAQQRDTMWQKLSSFRKQN